MFKRHCLIYFFLDNEVATTTKRRILSFLFAVLLVDVLRIFAEDYGTPSTDYLWKNEIRPEIVRFQVFYQQAVT